MRVYARITFAGHGGVRFFAQPEPLGIECAQGENKQYHGKNCGAALIILRSHNGKENLCREHVKIAAEYQRVAKIGHAFDEA